MYNAEKEKEKNMKNFDDLSNQAKKTKDEAVSYIKSEAKDGIRTAKEKARDAGKNVSEFLKTNGQRLRDAEERAERTIRSNPVTSTAAAFAAGLVLGALVKGSRRD